MTAIRDNLPSLERKRRDRPAGLKTRIAMVPQKPPRCYNGGCVSPSGRGGRVAEGGGLLNRYRVKSSIGGSNPPLSARQSAAFDSLLGCSGSSRDSGRNSRYLSWNRTPEMHSSCHSSQNKVEFLRASHNQSGSAALSSCPFALFWLRYFREIEVPGAGFRQRGPVEHTHA